jgi:tripartite-type tricarboxylate transporter receptor subunit TctC
VQQLVAAAKEAYGKMTFASVGVGSIPQFLGLMFQDRAHVKLTHVPYGGAAPATVDMLAGRIDLAFLNLPAVIEQIRAGKLRALAVAGPARAAGLPDVPTMAQQGYPDVEMSTWYGISAPAKTPPDVIATLDATIAQVLKSDAIVQKLSLQGVEVFYKNSADYVAFLQFEANRMLPLIEAAGMRSKE